jgi:uncharacterized damage-inducible protein DinB
MHDLWLILLRHNEWATREMLLRCRGLSDEQFHKRFDIGPGSLHDTFRHIVGAMARWADRIREVPVRPSPERDPRPRSIDELVKMVTAAAGELELAARELFEQDRTGEMMEWPRENAPPYRFHKTTALVHVATHGMHHRAHARWMMRQLGLELAEDFDTVEWELARVGQI